jgi:hypothetical protein
VAGASSFRRTLRRLASSAAALIGLAQAPHARAETNPAPEIVVGEPQGFADLTQEQTLIVDVFFGRVRRGEARIVASPGGIAFAEPASVVDLLPPLSDRAAVEAALGASLLPANAQLACSLASDPGQCGRLAPDVVGVIFDRNNFRLDVFVNPTFLAIEESLTDAYLPAPDGRLSAISSFGAIVSGRSGGSDTTYNIQNSLVAGFGERRLRADLSYATDFGLQADTLAVEWDRPGLRFSAGALWAPGSELAMSRKFIGVGVASQIDTRRDKDAMLGSPLVVYLDQRARIDVLRDGRLLGSAIYSAGNQQIDTANLPDGSYEIVLRIDEPGRGIREERRLFTKSRRIPSLGRTDFFAYAGLQVEGLARGALHPSDRPYAQAGVAHRLSDSWALSSAIELSDGGGKAEIAATLLTDLAQVRAAGLIDLDGAYGAILQLASSGSSRLNFNFDLRHVETRRAYAAVSGALGSIDSLAGGSMPPAHFGGSYSQAGGLVSYSLDTVRVLATMLYRDDGRDAARYSIGPSVEWDVLRRGPFLVTLRGDMTATERGRSAFAGISLRMFGANSSLTALTGARTSGIAGDEVENGPVTTLAGSWSPRLAGGELSVGAGLERRTDQENATLSSEFRHRLGSFAGDLVRSRTGDRTATQYAAGFQTSVIAGAGGLRLAGRTTSDSVIVAQVDGARPEDSFEVLVNEQVAGTVEGSNSLNLALPPYRAYTVRIRPTGPDLVAYDSSPREVGLYPGSVTRVAWTAAPVTIRIGRLLGADGNPLAGASLTAKGVWARTDDDGYFQIEAGDRTVFEVTLRDGRKFDLTLPAGAPSEGVVRVGAVVCCGPGDMLYGARDGLPRLANGGSR